MSDAEQVNHPRHYVSSPAKCSKCGAGIECIDVVEHFGFSVGNAVKYLWRAGKKGPAIVDMKKPSGICSGRSLDSRKKTAQRSGARAPFG